MNSITGFSVLKKPFSWKFSKYSKFSKKMKLHLNEKEDLSKTYWEDGKTSPTDRAKDISNENSQESASSSWDLSERWVSSDEETWQDDEYCFYSTPSSSPRRRSPDEDSFPLYENGDMAGTGCMREDIEPIYESVVASKSPANLFLSLVGSQETISPDANIYEVPPGAILNISGLPEDSPNNITPPNEFQDELFQIRNGLNELNPMLEDLYSRVNKTKMETIVSNVTEAANSPEDEIYCQIEEVIDNESGPEDYASASESELDSHSEKKEDDSAKRNIGAQIMERYEAEKKKAVESLNLPEVSILDVEESFEDIEKERKRIISSQVVKKKRINSWIKENDLTHEDEQSYVDGIVDMREDGEQQVKGAEESIVIVEVTSDDEETSYHVDIEDSVVIFPHASESEGEIVYDSILQNKEKTKNYWEKLMLATKMAADCVKKAALEETTGKPESVVEREIRLQREREEALNLERRNAMKLAKYAEDGLHSIPTTDEGNFSECSEEKDHSLDSSSEQEASFTTYQRTLSFESMSSGHSSGSDGGGKQKSHRKSDESKAEEPRILKESPIEKDIRIAKEREEECKSKSKIFSINSKINSNNNNKQVKEENRRASDNYRLSTNKFDSKYNTINKNNNKDEIRAELESISLKKCVSMSNLPLATNNESVNDNTGKFGLKKFRQATPRHSLNETASKVMTPTAKIPRGLMKRFIESHGRLPTSFIISPPTIQSTPQRKVTVPKPVQVPKPSPPVVKTQEPTTPSFRRPGYRSAEDKIQMELKEMKRREAELKKERARLLGRSQPNLLNIGLNDEPDSDNESCSLPQMGKLRSALSNPNLTIERMVIIPKRCNELIDAWENMIQKKNED